MPKRCRYGFEITEQSRPFQARPLPPQGRTLRTVKLDGTWLASELDSTLLASAPDPELDDSNWQSVQVPSQRAHHAKLCDSTAPVVYRKHFQAPASQPGRRAWLKLAGVIGDAEVWLDGNYLGEANEYFKASQFDVTSLLTTETPHLLAVEVADVASATDRAKRSLSGALHESHLSAPGSPAGIWKTVSIEETGPVAILHSRLICTKATAESAVLSFRLVLDSASAGRIQIETSITSPSGDSAGSEAQPFTVASGENQIEWSTTVANPELWWPAELGEQPLYDVTLTIQSFGQPSTDADYSDSDSDESTSSALDSEVSDRASWRTGLRTVEIDKFIWKVNGESIFIKGVTHGPTDPLQSHLAEEHLAEDAATALAAGLNLIRIYGHVSYPELYNQADRLGLLIWQDLPLVGAYAAATRKAALSMARATTDALGHHPSVAVWCAHDEPNGPPLPPPKGTLDPLGVIGKHLGKHLMPSWNRSILDPLLRRQLRHSDPSRRVITRSGSLPGLANRDRSDPHLWLGWHSGKASDLTKLLKRWPRIGSFLGGFGTQSAQLENWGLDEPAWTTAQQGAFQRYMPRRAYASGIAWANASRSYQADVLRQHIETIRRLKYRPSGGFCLSSLVDAEQSGGFGILDYQRQPKPAFEATVDACRAVVVIGDRLPEVVTPGQQISLQVHAVSDLRVTLEDVTIHCRVSAGNWETAKNWQGSITSDTCSLVGSLDFTVPATYGTLIVDIDLSHSEHVATNRYQSAVIPKAESAAGSAAVSEA